MANVTKLKYPSLKNIRFIPVAASLVYILSSCSLFKAKYGCPGNGKNVGAERILSGEKVPKAKKFKA